MRISDKRFVSKTHSGPIQIMLQLDDFIGTICYLCFYNFLKRLKRTKYHSRCRLGEALNWRKMASVGFCFWKISVGRWWLEKQSNALSSTKNIAWQNLGHWTWMVGIGKNMLPELWIYGHPLSDTVWMIYQI